MMENMHLVAKCGVLVLVFNQFICYSMYYGMYMLLLRSVMYIDILLYLFCCRVKILFYLFIVHSVHMTC